MKSGITVVEAKRQKKELEEVLLLRIAAFESETGCSVEDVKLACVKAVGHQSEVRCVDVDCTL